MVQKRGASLHPNLQVADAEEVDAAPPAGTTYVLQKDIHTHTQTETERQRFHCMSLCL